MRTQDQPSVRMPPNVPLTISFSSLNSSSLRTRNTRKTRNKRTTRNNDKSDGLPSTLLRLMSASTNSKSAMQTRTTSKAFQARSCPKKYDRIPWSQSLTAISVRKMSAKAPSIKIHPSHMGAKSALTPSSNVFNTITSPKVDSIFKICLSRLTTSVCHGLGGPSFSSAVISLTRPNVDALDVPVSDRLNVEVGLNMLSSSSSRVEIRTCFRVLSLAPRSSTDMFMARRASPTTRSLRSGCWGCSASSGARGACGGALGTARGPEEW
mmetsp:Transcript_21541/g.61670  ORF Transcript_21541/g.61670 Transcript_21541/m.61670 type:complete len:266 (-) Transcript_21541:423-1220(-)